MPLEQMAVETAKNKQSANVVAVGAAMALTGFDSAASKSAALDYFGSGEAGQTNAAAAVSGFEYAKAHFIGRFGKRVNPPSGHQRMLLNGNEAIALGAVASGCKFMAAYPMTPLLLSWSIWRVRPSNLTSW
jgi:2-oxoglutarate ferredoxin oxidoreductase subunit alpha